VRFRDAPARLDEGIETTDKVPVSLATGITRFPETPSIDSV